MTAPHGIKGLLKIELITDRPEERFAEGRSVFVGDRQLTVERFSRQPKGCLLGVKEIGSREEAEALRGAELSAARTEAELGEGEFFQDDLIGFRVVTEEGRDLGTLREIITTGANDVYEVGIEERLYLIPAVKDVISQVDEQQRRIIIREVEGLLE